MTDPNPAPHVTRGLLAAVLFVAALAGLALALASVALWRTTHHDVLTKHYESPDGRLTHDPIK